MPDSGTRYIEINSALVSAQNRQRFYVHNCGEVGQPADRGVLLKDILETGIGLNDKSYCLDANYYKGGNFSDLASQSGKRLQVAQPVNMLVSGKARTIKAQYARNSMTNFFDANYGASAVAEPVIFQTPRGNNEGGCKYKKSPTLTAHGSWQENNKVVEPVCVAQRGRYTDTGNRSQKTAGKVEQYFEAREDSKTNALTTVQKDNGVAVPVRVGTYPGAAKNKDSKQYRIYSEQGKATTLCGEGGGNAIYYAEMADGTKQPIYEVKDGKITVKGRQYPIKLADGFYIIRKLTVTECCRLQTMPDNYCRAVSATQGYRGLGNGWTAEVIIHILNGALKDVPKDEEIVVLSMYDGIGTGRHCLDKMGFTNVKYYAYEIDKFAIRVAMSNYPDIVQCGDAFQVRQPDWKLN